MRSKPSASKSSQQCCYDGKGKLITHGTGAGTPDKKAPGYGHQAEDVVPYRWAVECDGGKPGENVAKYLDVRPPNNGNDCEKNPPEPILERELSHSRGRVDIR